MENSRYRFRHLVFGWKEDRWGQFYWVAYRRVSKTKLVPIASGLPQLTTEKSGRSLVKLRPMLEQLDMMYEEKTNTLSAGVKGKSRAKS